MPTTTDLWAALRHHQASTRLITDCFMMMMMICVIRYALLFGATIKPSIKINAFTKRSTGKEKFSRCPVDGLGVATKETPTTSLS
jgi:hypothetical protein